MPRPGEFRKDKDRFSATSLAIRTVRIPKDGHGTSSHKAGDAADTILTGNCQLHWLPQNLRTLTHRPSSPYFLGFYFQATADIPGGNPMIKVGTLSSIWRYPVKGMAGEQLQSASLGGHGIRGDRIWAVQDNARQEIQSCKFRPQLLQCRARCLGEGGDGDAVEILFPNGQRLSSDDDSAHRRISDLIGYPSTLQPLRPASDRDFYRRYKPDDHSWLEELKATFIREPGEPLPDLDNLPAEMQEYVSLPGSFFLVSPLHILTTASLAHMRAMAPESDWHLERFRPNIVIETELGNQGLVEQEWLGRSLYIGDVKVTCRETAPRCGAVVRAQQQLDEDKRILRRIVRYADQNLGIYGDTLLGGEVSVGDGVYLY